MWACHADLGENLEEDEALIDNIIILSKCFSSKTSAMHALYGIDQMPGQVHTIVYLYMNAYENPLSLKS